MSSLDYLDLCRLCLVKDRASVPIFEGEGDVRQIFLKIAACLPVKVVRGDKLPKKICDDCVYKVEQFYQFWNTTANVEKQLLQWLGDVGMEDKQAYVSGVLNPDQSVEGRLNANVIQQTDEHQNNMGMNMMDTMNLDMPMMMQTEQSQMTTMNSNDTNVQTIQAVPGTSVRPPQQERRKDDEDESSEDEDNSDDECDADEGLSVKEETEETANRTIEPTFVNVSLPCDEAGPSGLQQQKINEMSDMVMAQSTDGDPKSGSVKEEAIDCQSSLNVEKSPIEVIYPDLNNQEDSSKNLEDNDSNEFHECTICKKRFRSKNLFDGHLIAHSDARPYQCDICNKSFKRTSTLAVHRRIHTRERNYICDVCGRAFVQASQLATHHRRHFEKYLCSCTICGKGFFTNAELHGHMNVKHGAKQHVCHQCGKSFPNNHTLMRHSTIHDPNFKPIKHQCEFCGKIFSYKNSLVVHVKSHTGDNKYDCHLCGKSVSSKGSLQDHLRLHGGEKSLICDVCGKAFHKRTTLVVHKRTHTGEKPYSCETCGKSFTQHSTLVIHRRYHTGQRPYECTHCTKSFVSRALLNAHNKVHETTLSS